MQRPRCMLDAVPGEVERGGGYSRVFTGRHDAAVPACSLKRSQNTKADSDHAFWKACCGSCPAIDPAGARGLAGMYGGNGPNYRRHRVTSLRRIRLGRAPPMKLLLRPALSLSERQRMVSFRQGATK